MEQRAAGKTIDGPLITLDIARSLAAFAVLFAHVRGAEWVDFGALPPAQRTASIAVFFAVTRLGNEAVMIFFVLSGFLVGGKIIERVMAGRFEIASYALDRATRILIPLIPACLFTAIVTVGLLHQPLGVGQVAANMVGLNGLLAPTLIVDGPLWSLPFEIWFYILGGAVALWFSRPPRGLVAIVLGLSILCFAQMGAAYLLFWGLGALTTLALKVPRPRMLFVAGLAFCALGVLQFQLGLASLSLAAAKAAPRNVAQGLICIGCCLTLPFLCRRQTNLKLMVLRRAASFTAGFSYTLYLFHYPINSALDLVFPRSHIFDAASVEAFLLRLAICILGALVAWVLFERNTQAVRRFLAARLTSRPRPAPPPLPGVAAAQADAGVGVTGLEPN